MIKPFFAALTASVLSFAPISWGLHHHGNETLPTPPVAGVEMLKTYDGLHVVDTQDKKVYLTFDLGYEAGYTAQVLDILKANNIKAIFFLCGNYLQETDLIERMIAEGHTIGNHTDKHKDLPTLGSDAVTTDIMTLQNEFTTKFPHAPVPTFMRPPKGRFDESTCKIAHDNGLRTMLWSIAIKDWGKSAIPHQKSAQTIMDRIHPGAIILLHITNGGVPATVETLLPMLSSAGYTIGNPSEI